MNTSKVLQFIIAAYEVGLTEAEIKAQLRAIFERDWQLSRPTMSGILTNELFVEYENSKNLRIRENERMVDVCLDLLRSGH